MQYSLLSRFRGILLGTALGETLPYALNIPGKSDAGKMTIAGIESLIRLGRFDLPDWRDRLISINPTIPIGAIVPTIPVALIYHENKLAQRQNLQQLLEIWTDDPVLKEAAVALGYALTLALTENLNLATLIPKTINYLDAPESVLTQQLTQINTLLLENSSLEKAITQLRKNGKTNSLPVAIAFYCFLSTPEDFRLTITRASRSGYQPQISSAIAGALSGAYNSIAGIPVGLRLAFKQPDWGITSATQLLQLADTLFALWCGAYDPANAQPNQILSAVAAPHIIQRR